MVLVTLFLCVFRANRLKFETNEECIEMGAHENIRLCRFVSLQILWVQFEIIFTKSERWHSLSTKNAFAKREETKQKLKASKRREKQI